VNPGGPRQVVQADDWITKFQGTWVSTQGKTMFVQARYVAWVIFAFVFPAVLLVDYVLTGSVSILPLTDAAIAVVITYGVANLTNGEVTLAHAGVYALRWGRQLGTRGVALVRTPRRARTTVHSDRLRVQLCSVPDSMPEPLPVLERSSLSERRSPRGRRSVSAHTTQPGSAAGPLPGRELPTAARPARIRG
jgi:hypothetical protein